MNNLDTMLITAHRGNIRRYKRLLRTHLTDLERSFVLRRMDEEKSALRDLLRKHGNPQAQPFPDHFRSALLARAEAR